MLLVDDEQPIVSLLRSYLEREGMLVLVASDGASALELIREREPDVVVMDVMLPVLDGIEVLRRLRAFSDAYVLMVSARGEELDRLLGLSVGADDYLVKPVSPREVVARVRALLRRPRPSREGPGRSRFGALTIDEAGHQVSVDDAPVALTALEFRLLLTMAHDPGVVLSRAR